jgi:hypothetical protein
MRHEGLSMTSAQLFTLAPMIQGDERDADLMSLYARLALSPRGRLMLLAGLAGFNRTITED